MLPYNLDIARSWWELVPRNLCICLLLVVSNGSVPNQLVYIHLLFCQCGIARVVFFSTLDIHASIDWLSCTMLWQQILLRISIPCMHYSRKVFLLLCCLQCTLGIDTFSSLLTTETKHNDVKTY